MKIKKNEFVIERTFDAPKEIVFRAWTEPELIKKWWGPKGYSGPIIKVDFRKGGKYLYAMKEDKSGKISWSGGEFIEIDAPNRIVVSDYFADEKGNKKDPTDYGLDKDFPKESIVTLEFNEENGKTNLKIKNRVPKTEDERKSMVKSGMEEGWNSSLDKFNKVIEGMKIICNVYLIFSGECKQAMEYYQSIFGGELKMQMYNETGMPFSEEDKDKVIHARLDKGDIILMASDDNSKSPVKKGNNVQISLSGTDEKRMTEIFNKLAIGGKVNSHLKKEFWGDIFGMITDKYGVQWMINISTKQT